MQTTTLKTNLSNARLYQTRYRKIDIEITLRKMKLAKMELSKMDNIYDTNLLGNTT